MLRAATRAVQSVFPAVSGRAASSLSSAALASPRAACSTGGASTRNRTCISLPSASVTSAVAGMRGQVASASSPSSKSDGLIPRIRSRPKYSLRPGLAAKTASGTGSRRSANTTAGPSSRTRLAPTKFIAGDPMNPATNRLTGALNSACGLSACCSLPSRMTQTRCPSVIASTWSCVTYTVVTPSRSCSCDSDARIETRSLASRLDSGSSMRNAFGSLTIARPIATRCR